MKRTNNALLKAKEKAEQSDKLKTAFLANMSHEIRTPLNAIVGFSQLLRDASSKEEVEQFVEIINSNNALLLRLINDILDLSKIDSGSVKLKPVRVNVEELLQGLMRSASQIVNPEVKLVAESEYKSCYCLIDRERLMQVWNNFMTNAIKHTHSGHIKFGYENRDNGLYIYVKDTGVGIEDEKQSRIFSRFDKLNSYAQGSGLGLSICKAIVEMFNGDIGFTSKKNEGSYFWAWIPVKCEAETK